MRVVYTSFALNALALVLKLATMLTSNSAAVNAEFLHALGDFIGSGLLALGVAISTKAPSIKYPFGYGRSTYIFGLLSASVIGGFLFTLSLLEGVNRITTREVVVSSSSALALLLTAAAADLAVLAWALWKYPAHGENPALKGTVIENLVDTVGNVAALTALLTLNPLIDAHGAFVISAILLVSSLNLGYKYFNVLIGRSAPKNVVGRAIKIAVSIPYIVDVNDVKSLIIGPNDYLLIMQLEVPPNLSAEDIQKARSELTDKLTRAEPRIKYLIAEFVTPRDPPGTFRKLLSEVIKLGE
ncbi:MAG: cation diffusion facilitator family transporter [Desulfurococcales archaeon]|nr:cation diffusion facilitator family transporter [Desulfurococcales archaeon]